MDESHNIIIREDEEEEISYFYYSRQQQKELEDHVNIFGGRIIHGTVLNEGSMRLYTEVTTHDDSRYSDAVLVAKGRPSEMVFTSMVMGNGRGD